MAKIALEAGKRITCQTNNHFICEVIETINQGDANYSKKLGNWQYTEPERGSFPVCPECGSWWFSGNVFHIENEGWISNFGTVKFIEEKRYVPEPTLQSAIAYLHDFIVGKKDDKESNKV